MARSVVALLALGLICASPISSSAAPTITATDVFGCYDTGCNEEFLLRVQSDTVSFSDIALPGGFDPADFHFDLEAHVNYEGELLGSGVIVADGSTALTVTFTSVAGFSPGQITFAGTATAGTFQSSFPGPVAVAVSITAFTGDFMTFGGSFEGGSSTIAAATGVPVPPALLLLGAGWGLTAWAVRRRRP